MNSTNGTPRNATTPININGSQTQLEKLRKHYDKHQELYWAGALGAVSTLVIMRGLGWGRKPKIDEGAIVWNWMVKQAQSGFNIYALTNEQKELWEEAFAWAVKTSDSMNKDITWVLKNMARDYREFPIPLPYPANPASSLLG